MTTAGYDVMAQINEDLINKFMKIGYCIGKFPTFSGTYTLPIEDVPASLQEFMDIGYEVSLAKAPTIDFTADLSMMMDVRGQAKFTVLGGIEFELEAEFRVAVKPTFDQITRMFRIEFVEAVIEDIELNDTYNLPPNVLNKLNEILGIAMNEYLTEEITSIELSPVLFALDLPYMPPGDANKLTIGLGNVKVLNSSVMAAAVNLLGYTGGNVSAITDFTAGNHIGLGVNENGMHRVYDFWWARTTHPKSVTKTQTHDFDMPSIVDFMDEIVDWVVAVATLGLVDVDIDIDRVWADYGANIRFSKFDFDLKPGNTVQLSGSVSADVWLKVYIKYTTTTSILWGAVDVDETTNTVTVFDVRLNGITIDIENAEGTVTMNEDHQLMVNITDLDITIPLPWELPEVILDYVVDWLIDQIVVNMPPIVLFPAIISQQIPDTSVTVDATVESLEINEAEALITANIGTSNMGSYAPYVANKNPESMELHKRECEWAHRIAFRNRVYYCELEEALAAGYDGCAYCLPEYNTG
ncbi:MAG: hypothetical protein D4R88_05965 [Methanosarcinales archaeon]|nr:MAG: hypothetical protein D4R88_05965 [Methanosarcinales archaeon]